MDKLSLLFKSLLELFNKESKSMTDVVRDIKLLRDHHQGYYTYFTGIIMGAKIHLDRKQSYETYLEEHSFKLSSQELEQIDIAKVSVKDTTTILYQHLYKILETNYISIDTKKMTHFIEAVDDLNDIYYNITDDHSFGFFDR